MERTERGTHTGPHVRHDLFDVLLLGPVADDARHMTNAHHTDHHRWTACWKRKQTQSRITRTKRLPNSPAQSYGLPPSCWVLWSTSCSPPFDPRTPKQMTGTSGASTTGAARRQECSTRAFTLKSQDMHDRAWSLRGCVTVTCLALHICRKITPESNSVQNPQIPEMTPESNSVQNPHTSFG